MDKIEEIFNDYRRKYKTSYDLCGSLISDTKNKLGVDRPRLTKDTIKCIRGFQALFELVVRDMGLPTLGYNESHSKPIVSDWFEDARRSVMGSSQAGTDGGGGKNESGEVSF